MSCKLTVILYWTLGIAACESSGSAVKTPPAPADAVPPLQFAGTPDSAWVTVDGPTLIAFHPVVSNDSLEADPGLATAFDDLSYHIGTAMDSLIAAGFTVHYSGGDTLWVRTGSDRSRILRARDSATVGYLFADARGRRVMIYGVLG